ncbi:M14 family metallopeptidase [Pseudalkalibacillus berkeleyi]|uniref:LysM peptidoglycan-binding domain-containing protein n=1 Tax=Pseudalkalibacillus berkeleyi TaxID=1069813 RepID=A0ABS9GYS9_9BACL|nr:M14 family zinc carboxypeptidase [Pseudalkalibacillus berkeleyi]MCF6137899.1 LysM peptidoglycan-binding domain-containing protein [Pseudalkalibacillus berkeleyi]
MRVRIRSGDSLWYFAKVFNIPLRLVIDSNRSVDPSQLQVGQQVNIPGYVIGKYTIQKGDTFYKIAQRRKLPLEALTILNQNVSPSNLQIGQVIELPVRVLREVVTPKENYDYALMMHQLKRLNEIYPFIKMKTIGRSVLGQSIPEIQIGNGRKKVHFNGAFHAQEWITTSVLMNFINDYLLSLTNQWTIRGLNMSPFYDGVTLSIVPMVNPDGVDLVLNGPPDHEYYDEYVLDLNNGSKDFSSWKANIRGVDLNNQYPAKWEIEKERKPKEPAPRDYPGTKPLSEPEAIAMADLTRKENFDRVIAFHTQGEEIYWGYEGLEPSYAETIVQEYERVSGYKPIQYIDSYAGYKDWFIQEWKRPGYTVELGEGVNPLPIEQYDEIYEESLGIMLASLYM